MRVGHNVISPSFYWDTF